MINGCTNCDDLTARVAALEAQLDHARETLRAAGMSGDLANVADGISQLALVVRAADAETFLVAVERATKERP